MFDIQYGFRTEHITEFAALDLTDRIIAQMDKKEKPIHIYLDICKAFDILDHAILFEPFECYGVKGIALTLIRNYLTDRKQYVEIEDAKSNMLNILTGSRFISRPTIAYYMS